MEQQVLRTIGRYNMFVPGDHVVVALSGGADSMALLHLLLGLQDRLGIRLSAAHFNHGLRGEASDRDAAHCAAFCESEGIRLYSKNGGMTKGNNPKGLSEEMWARQQRYAFFEELAAQGAKIATAHTLSDNAETVLFNAIRGSSSKGLSGIPPVRGPFCRPLLEVSGEEVRAYCAREGLAYCTDATNADTAYSRNLLRLQVMPLLEQAHPGARRALARLSGEMREIDDYLAQGAQALLAGAEAPQKAGTGGGQQGWCAKTLAEAPAPLRKKALALLAGERDIDSKTLRRLESVVLGQARTAQVAGGRVFCRTAGHVYWQQAGDGASALPQEPLWPLEAGEYTLTGGFSITLQCVDKSLDYELFKKTMEKGLTFVADCDKILQCGCLRTRQPGDRFAPRGRGLSKAVGKWMQEEGVPVQQRGALPLIAHRGSGQVLWLWGGGFCEGTQPGADTKRLLSITTRLL